jgi:hypothetical protein
MMTKQCDAVYGAMSSERREELVRLVMDEVRCCGEYGVGLVLLVEDHGSDVLGVVWQLIKSRTVRGVSCALPGQAADDYGVSIEGLMEGSIQKVGELVTSINRPW